MECLEELVSSSVVLVHQRCSTHGIKTCNIQSVYWHLCNKEARKEKFFHVINTYANSSTDGIKSQRRLSVHNNTLLGIEEVRNSMESISTVHSLLCTGPHHQYPVPICFGLRLLRILDALTICFYKFPIEVLKLVHLKYLALTYSGKKIPASISKLWKLEFLIVRQNRSIINSSKASSYLPVEIWDMKELKHLQVIGSDLLDPYHSHCRSALLQGLFTLSGLSVHSCSKEILKKNPNLKKLGIQIELVPDHAVELEPLWYFDHISHFCKLESLKCVSVNPNFAALGPPCPASSINTTSFLCSTLRKLSLSGFGYPWEYMSIIAKLPHLMVLKLRSYAFEGLEWVAFEGEFPRLEHLLLEDTDLKRWRAFDSNCDILPFLRRPIIMHCYKLKEIPLQMGGINDLRIELVDCPAISVEQINELDDCPAKQIKCVVHSSWDE